jgi:hypothetical protein
MKEAAITLAELIKIGLLAVTLRKLNKSFLETERQVLLMQKQFPDNLNLTQATLLPTEGCCMSPDCSHK